MSSDLAGNNKERGVPSLLLRIFPGKSCGNMECEETAFSACKIAVLLGSSPEHLVTKMLREKIAPQFNCHVASEDEAACRFGFHPGSSLKLADTEIKREVIGKVYISDANLSPNGSCRKCAANHRRYFRYPEQKNDMPQLPIHPNCKCRYEDILGPANVMGGSNFESGHPLIPNDHGAREATPAEELWHFCWSIAKFFSAFESGYIFNFKGFLHWLEGSGSTVQLQWEHFDCEYKVAWAYFKLVFDSNRNEMHSLLKTMRPGEQKYIEDPLSIDMSRLSPGYSHNGWISLFNIYGNGKLEISLYKDYRGRASGRIIQPMLCYDISDFNEGESFGPNDIFKDDTFIELRNAGYGRDYLIYALGKFQVEALFGNNGFLQLYNLQKIS